MWYRPTGRGVGFVASRRAGVSFVVAAIMAACSSGVNQDGSATPVATDSSGSVLTGSTTAPLPGLTSPDGTTTGGDGAVITAPASTLAVAPATLTWESAGGGLEQAWLKVPIDYANPTGPTMNLYVLRRPAANRDRVIGSLLVNPGGPGFPGSELARVATSQFDPELLTYFDIIGWDPRGTGRSEMAIDCTSDYDHFFTEIDSTPETAADRQVLVDRATEFANDCRESNGDVLRHVGTNNSARDMNQLRIALGEEKISYFGFSYGSELGAVWTTLFPDTVRAAVLDGAIDPTVSKLESNVDQLAGFEASLGAFFDWCTDTGCGFVSNGENPATVFEQLSNDLDSSPIPGDQGRPPVNRDVLLGAVVSAMYSDSLWNALARSLRDARNGDGAGLMALFDQYYQRNPNGDYSNTLEAFTVISCMDESTRETPEQSDAAAPQFHQAAPLLFPEDALPGYSCNFFPASVDPRIDVTGREAGPILVIGTTGDPATPLASTKRMAETLEGGVFVTVEGNQHTGYGTNSCIVDIVDNYLIDLTVPDDGTVCA